MHPKSASVIIALFGCLVLTPPAPGQPLSPAEEGGIRAQHIARQCRNGLDKMRSGIDAKTGAELRQIVDEMEGLAKEMARIDADLNTTLRNLNVEMAERLSERDKLAEMYRQPFEKLNEKTKELEGKMREHNRKYPPNPGTDEHKFVLPDEEEAYNACRTERADLLRQTENLKREEEALVAEKRQRLAASEEKCRQAEAAVCRFKGQIEGSLTAGVSKFKDCEKRWTAIIDRLDEHVRRGISLPALSEKHSYAQLLNWGRRSASADNSPPPVVAGNPVYQSTAKELKTLAEQKTAYLNTLYDPNSSPDQCRATVKELAAVESSCVGLTCLKDLMETPTSAVAVVKRARVQSIPLLQFPRSDLQLPPPPPPSSGGNL
jgi:hypothetical protein